MATLIEERNPVTVGVDIGQISDPTAISVAEVSQVDTGKLRVRDDAVPSYYDSRGYWVPAEGIDRVMKSEYTIRHIRRLPLGTSYPDVALHLADMLCSPLFAQRRVRVLIDVTGVGRPVYDDLRKEISLRKEAVHVQLQPISFVHGEKYNRSTGTLGKAYLVSRLQSLLQGSRVHAPDTPEVKVMLEELRVFEVKVSDDGKDSYGAFKTGTHDDLAVSLGLATLEDPFGERVSYSKRVY